MPLLDFVLMRLDFCVACGHKECLDYHHLVPKSLGGSDEDTNLVTLCRECHGLLHGRNWSNSHGDLQRQGYARAKANGIQVGRPAKLSPTQQADAIQRRQNGEPVNAIAKDYDVHRSNISRLCNRERIMNA